jgi:succinoglycan biosynthesis protein ExoV
MRIVRWSGPPNFGDDLNMYLWPKLLTLAINEYLPDSRFYGIGSILGAHMSPASHYVVFGAGAGYTGQPTFPSPTKTYFVRGPLTARSIGNVPYITDPGILVRRFFKKADPIYPVSFMPRWNSMGSEFEEQFRKTGFHLIDPRQDVVTVMEAIASTGLLLTEALHGAICADAIRVPWISIRAQDHSDFKWYDWCGSMNMVWNPIDAVNLGLTWARDYAVPQLSAASVLESKTDKMLTAIDRFNHDVIHDEVFV